MPNIRFDDHILTSDILLRQTSPIMRQTRRRVGLMLDLEWPFEHHLSVFAGTQTYAQEVGNWECVLDERVPETVSNAAGERVYDGVIARATDELAKVAKKYDLPVVNTWLSSPVTDLPLVAPDLALAAKIAAQHLFAIGLGQFVCIGVKGVRADTIAVDAFTAAVRDKGGACATILAPRKYYSSPEVRNRFHLSLPAHIASWQPPLGIYVTTVGMMARYVAHLASQQGLRIPQDIAIVAGVNQATVCLYPPPALSSVEISFEDVGYQAAKLLDEQMKRRTLTKAERLVAPRRLVARQSTDSFATSDPLVLAALQVIVERVHKPLGVGEIAQMLHASRRTLERRFQEVLGRTVASEIRRIRIERAKRFLLDTSLPIKAIALSAGFTSKQRMYEAFRAAGEPLPTSLRGQSS
jgi:LacI family transcriptional regulator